MTNENSPAYTDTETMSAPPSRKRGRKAGEIATLHLDESASEAFAAAQENTEAPQPTGVRLADCAQKLQQAYDVWADNMEGEASTRDLSAALHGLRRITSRIEIEMAAMAAPDPDDEPLRPIPAPVHRAARQLM